MSNSLEKTFLTEYTLIPGYTIRRWHPAETVTTTRYVTTTSADPTPRLIPEGADFSYSLGDTVLTGYWKPNVNPLLPDEFVYYRSDHATLVYGLRTVTEAITETHTIPGYYTYDIQPDTYALSYNPNLGWNASGRSLDVINGDGTASFSVPVSSVGVVVGLNEPGDSSGSDYFEITYGVYCTRGIYRVLEAGAVKYGGLAYSEGDVFSITRTDGEVVYALNATPFYTSLTESTAPLLLDASLYAGGDVILDASLVASAANLHAQTNFVGVIAAISSGDTFTFTYDGDPYTATMGSIAGGLLAAIQAAIDAQVGAGLVLASISASGLSLILTAATAGIPLVGGVFTDVDNGSAETAAIDGDLTELVGAFGPLSALLTSGFSDYAAINGGFAPMTAQLRESELSNSYAAIAGAFSPMTAEARCLVGTTTLNTVQAFAPMIAILADHAHHEINGSFRSMVAALGSIPPIVGLNVYGGAFATTLTAELSAAENLRVSGGAFHTSLSAHFGANIAGGAFHTALTATISGAPSLFISGGSFTSALTATITNAAKVTVAGGAFSTALDSHFGWRIAGGGFASSLTATLTGWASMAVSGGAFHTAVDIGITGYHPMHIAGGAFHSQLLWMEIAGGGFHTGLQATISTTLANAVAYVLNIHSTESTRYSNYPFLHIIAIGSKYYGVTGTGLYEINATIATDALPVAGTAINGKVTLKDTDFGDFHSKHVPYVYLNSDTATRVTPIVDGARKGTYASSFSGKKTKLGKGNSGRYWTFEIEHIIELQGAEFLPESRQRRVK
ncbi:MAG: hypothetical protein PHT88_04830 [Candidatus Moranbacteria bacterium]|nr:hypothetical protein [Candidatus Moranbacteria bacterium]